MTSAKSTFFKSPLRMGAWAMLAGLALLLAWAAIAPLDQGVPVSGFVAVEGNRKTVQHQRGGIVDALLVKEGQIVKKGELLIRLNETQLKAQATGLEGQLASSMAIESRLLAERDNRAAVAYPAFLTERAKQYGDILQVQSQLFLTRKVALKGEESIGQETVAGLEAFIVGVKAQERSKAEQLRLFNEELSQLAPLVEQGFVPRNRLLDIQRQIALLQGQRSEDLASILRSERQIQEARLKIIQSRSVYQKEVETQLSEVQRQSADLRERLVATQDELDRVLITAPTEGSVVDLSVHTVGGVLAPGQKLMDIVPLNDGMVLEVKIPPNLIDNIHPGLKSDVHFLAFESAIVPPVPGTLRNVSADRLTDPRNDQSYFVGYVTMDPADLKVLGNRVILPGMPVSVVIKTGERSMLSYLLKPLLNRLHGAFTER